MKLVSVDMRLWFWMGSEVTSPTLAWQPVLGTNLHKLTTIYSWILTGWQWMKYPLVLARGKSHLESMLLSPSPVILLWEPGVNSEEPCTADIH